MTNDNIVEGDEMFSMSLKVPSSPGIVAGSLMTATGVIIDTSEISVRFAQAQYTGLEANRVMLVTLQLIEGASAYSFNVTVTPSEQSPLSAEGNSIMCMIVC